ncbi:hypothetical protein ACFQ9X_00310 [Catenulispora yoronensis]
MLTSRRRGPLTAAAGFTGVLCLMPAFAAAAPLPAQIGNSGGTVLVTESFTGATADSRFHSYGPACLTGAPLGGGTSGAPLGGCATAGEGPVPPPAGAPYGYLRLTDASRDQSAAVLFNQPLPAAEGVKVTFDQWQYGGTPDTPASSPADGISFFLVDGAAQLTRPGAFGGSLGYAQKLPDDVPSNPFVPGVEHGYLGVGLDALGNYFGDWERRGYTCPAGHRSPSGTAFYIPAPGHNMVTVRGPGEGTNGYCFLTATADHFGTAGPWLSTLPGRLHGPTTAADLPAGTTPAQAETVLKASQRTFTVEVTPAPNPQVEVFADFHDGAGARQVLSAPAPQPVPATYKFGFASSTGLFTDVHLIRTTTVSTINQLPALDLVKQIDEAHELPAELTAGAKVPYQFVVTNTGGGSVNSLRVADSRVSHVMCPVETLHAGQTVVCTGVYTVTAADVERGYTANTAVAHGSDSSGSAIESPEADHTLPLGGKVALELEKQVDDSHFYTVGKEVAYSYVVRNRGTRPADRLEIADDRVTGVTCEATVLAARDLPGDSAVCTGRYKVTSADAEAGHVTNVAVAVGDGGAVRSAPAHARIRIRRQLPATGAELLGPGAAAAALVTGGALLVRTTRRRRSGTAGR